MRVHFQAGKSEHAAKTTVASCTRVGFYQIKQFKVRLDLGEELLSDARAAMLRRDRRRALAEFNEKYPSRVYTGQFSAGGWFRTDAKATSSTTTDMDALEKVFNSCSPPNNFASHPEGPVGPGGRGARYWKGSLGGNQRKLKKLVASDIGWRPNG